jgi:hypothetical protein
MILTIDTTGYTSIQLNYQRSFERNNDYQGDTDSFIVEWHVGTGSSWSGATNVQTLSSDASWSSVSNFDLSGASGTIQIRFRLSTCDYSDEAWINNVSVTGLA